MKFRNTLTCLLYIFIGIYSSTTSAKSGFVPDGSIDPELETYPFKSGDGLYINTFPDTSSFLNGVYAIDDRGYIELPLVGKFNVTGMTVVELETYLKSNFKTYLRYMTVYVKPLIRVGMLGGFQLPGLYYVDEHNSLWEVVRQAGGPALEDGVSEMVWERAGEEKSDNLNIYFNKSTSLKRIGIRSGDIIWTPSPSARTTWDTVRDVTAIASFATTLIFLYLQYQRDYLYLQSR